MLLRLILLLALLLPVLPAQAEPALQDEAPLLKIGEVQGEVTPDEAEPTEFDSPYQRDRVRVSGIVTNPISIDSSGRKVNLFFLQEPPQESDGNPLTSDAIQVMIGTRTDFPDSGYTPSIGDRVTVEGEVEEYYGLTRLRNVDIISVDGRIDDLDSIVPPVELNPTGDVLDILRMYERIESMRVIVPGGAQVVSTVHLYSSSNDTEMYIVRGDHPVIQREDVFTRRVYRDSHELDDGLPGDNLYRISVEPNILKGLAGDYEINLPPYTPYQVFNEPLTGNIVFAFGRYTLQIDVLPDAIPGPAPYDNNPLREPDRSVNYTVASLNVENLYDFYDDPFDREDQPGSTRFNYVPMELTDYETRIQKLARQIVYGLYAPDIVGVQEIEDQDVCVGGQLYGTCNDEIDNANGQPDVLEDLALAIAELTDGDILYAATTDRDGADYRGIAQGFLYRTDRVELPEPDSDHPVFGTRPDDEDAERHEENQQVSNPKSLNRSYVPGSPVFARAPVLGWFRIHREATGSEDYVDIYFSNNHFKSNPTGYTELRENQSLYNLGLLEAIQAENPDARFIIGGDLNSFPESSEMSLLEETLVNLHYEVPAPSRYTYMYQGQMQTLDYLFVSYSLFSELQDVQIGHYNTDFSYHFEAQADNLYRAADHDAVVATFSFPE